MVYKVQRSRQKQKQDIGEMAIIKDKNGNISSEVHEVNYRWKKYFSGLLTRETPHPRRRRRRISNQHLKEQSEDRVEDDDEREGGRTIRTYSGYDQSTGKSRRKIRRRLLLMIWEEDEIPEDWKRSLLIPISKQKGDVQERENYRGINILEHTFNIIDKKLREIVEVDQMQVEFRPGKRTPEAIFVLGQIQEKNLYGQNTL